MIRVEDLTVALPGFALANIHLHVARGEAFALLGPTGAGKTLLLEAVMGVVPVQQGRILIDGRDVTGLPPERRRIGIVYQDHALFPHLNVEENIVYGQRYCTGSPPDLNALIQRLGLEHLLARRIHSLSGGEKQRVALARSLAVAPSVLLLDEPLTALDPNFREDLRDLIKTLHQDTDITLLMVTHDFAEAHFLAQRTAIMHSGRIEQTGSLEAVFSHPETPFVAGFVGMKNLFPAEIDGDVAKVGSLRLRCRNPGGGFGSIAIRPENVGISRHPEDHPKVNHLTGRLRRILNRGFYADILVDVNGLSWHAIDSRRDLSRSAVAEGETLYLTIAPEDIHLIGDGFDGEAPKAGS
jgi:molybdate/tungstate transport system ATP-binding protein